MIALVVSALGFELIGFQENDFPFLIVAINCSPKLSSDHEAGSTLRVCDKEDSPHPVKNSTPDPSA
jgi:hypothetical protein